MTVDVGYAGQPFITEMLDKIQLCKKWKEIYGYTYKIEIDGSCNKQTFKRLYDAGAEEFVVGSSGLFNLDDDVNNAYTKMIAFFEAETGVSP
jgi:D-allulose-6-phosphate 3-epimerase